MMPLRQLRMLLLKENAEVLLQRQCSRRRRHHISIIHILDIRFIPEIRRIRGDQQAEIHHLPNKRTIQS